MRVDLFRNRKVKYMANPVLNIIAQTGSIDSSRVFINLIKILIVVKFMIIAKKPAYSLEYIPLVLSTSALCLRTFPPDVFLGL